MNEGIIVRSVQVADTEYVLAVGDLWTESDDFFFLGDLSFWGHVMRGRFENKLKIEFLDQKSSFLIKNQVFELKNQVFEPKI